jgi:hypothetical protein
MEMVGKEESAGGVGSFCFLRELRHLVSEYEEGFISGKTIFYRL